MKKRLNEILALAATGDRASRIFDLSLMALIGLNVLAMAAETVDECYRWAPGLFDGFELFSVIAFSIEYILRVWCCTADERFSGSIKGRLRFMVSPMAVVDLLAILPFYLPFTGIDLRSFRAVRLFRLVRIAKLGRYSEALQLTGRILVSKRAELTMTLSVLLMLVLIASSIMYFAEHDAQPDKFSSIPATMWFSVATLSTVGYGDVFPITPIGKTLGSVIALLGVGMFALPTGIIGAAFVEEVQRKRGRLARCPHCGKSPVDLPVDRADG